MARSVGEGFRELDPRIQYFPKFGPKQNFGDYLPEIICKELLTYPKIDADVFRLIGSVIEEQRIRRNLRTANGIVAGQVAFWCCGARNATKLNPAIRAHCRFFGVRGPLTRDMLELPADTVLGDPGLLAPLFHAPREHSETLGRTVCVPHIEDPKSHDELLRISGADCLLHPEIPASEAALHDLLDKIASAGFVLTASLHGAIIACAYGRPFAFWDNGFVDTPFKWDDFAGSIGIAATFVRTVEEGRSAYRGFASAIAIPPLALILDACPFQARPAMLARALAHDGHAAADALRAAAAALDALPSAQTDEICRVQIDSCVGRTQRAALPRRIMGDVGLALRSLKKAVRS